jgi:CRP-like cAMP-binding protein
MVIENLERILREHPFLKDLKAEHVETLVGCASNRKFSPGEYLAREGDQADEFFLIREGQVVLEIYVPQRGGLRLETLGEGEILGWSWLVQPYRWHYDARAVTQVRALALDGKCLRQKSETDFELGYRLFQRFATIMEQRLEAARLQLLDVYRPEKV